MPPMRTFIAGDMVFGVSMAILLVGFAIWGVSRVMTIQVSGCETNRAFDF